MLILKELMSKCLLKSKFLTENEKSAINAVDLDEAEKINKELNVLKEKESLLKIYLTIDENLRVSEN